MIPVVWKHQYWETNSLYIGNALVFRACAYVNSSPYLNKIYYLLTIYFVVAFRPKSYFIIH